MTLRTTPISAGEVAERFGFNPEDVAPERGPWLWDVRDATETAKPEVLADAGVGGEVLEVVVPSGFVSDDPHFVMAVTAIADPAWAYGYWRLP